MIRERRQSGLILAILAAGLAGMSGGCKERQAYPAGTFQLIVENMVDDDLVLVKRLTIAAPGRRVVSLSDQRGEDRIVGDPDPRTGVMKVQVVFVADLIPLQPPAENVLRWMAQLKSSGTTTGGAGLIPVGSAKSLKDLATISPEPAYYPLSQDLKLGQVQGRELVLRVE